MRRSKIVKLTLAFFCILFLEKAGMSGHFEEYQKDPIAFVVQWVLTTETFHGVKPSDLKVTEILQGHRNNGVFKVTQTGLAEKIYIVKISPFATDLRVWDLNHCFLVDPEKADLENINQRLKKKQPLSREQLKFLPKIPKSLTVASISDESKKLYILLQEHADGNVVSSFQNPSVYQAVGKSLSAFHYLLAEDNSVEFKDIRTWTHGDPHNNNLFHDPKNGLTTLIDHANLKDQSTYDQVLRDVDEIFSRRLKDHREQLENDFKHILETDIDKTFSREDQLNRLKQVNWLEIENYQKIVNFFNLIDGFLAGYFVFMPGNMKNDITSYFQQQCLDQAYKLMNFQTGEEIDLYFFLRWKDILPPKWNACIRGQF